MQQFQFLSDAEDNTRTIGDINEIIEYGRFNIEGHIIVDDVGDEYLIVEDTESQRIQIYKHVDAGEYDESDIIKLATLIEQYKTGSGIDIKSDPY